VCRLSIVLNEADRPGLGCACRASTTGGREEIVRQQRRGARVESGRCKVGRSGEFVWGRSIDID
jgi:hypothetical protein